MNDPVSGPVARRQQGRYVVDHLVLTLFSVRGIFGSSCANPLDPVLLEHRLRLFESVCLPSMRAQTCRDFKWLIFVDPELPSRFRRRIEQSILDYPGYHVVDFVAGETMQGLGWLEAYIDQSATHVLTTLLDDDDAISCALIGYLQHRVNTALENGTLPILRFFGCEEPWQWDFCRSPDAPLGRVKPWTRRDRLGQRFPVSAGFSLCVEYPRLKLSARQFPHNLVVNACREEDGRLDRFAPLRERVSGFRARVRNAVLAVDPAWEGLFHATHYHVCTLAAPQAVITNHLDNLQYRRVLEGVELARPVAGPGTFPGVVIDWDKVARYVADIELPE